MTTLRFTSLEDALDCIARWQGLVIEETGNGEYAGYVVRWIMCKDKTPRDSERRREVRREEDKDQQRLCWRCGEERGN